MVSRLRLLLFLTFELVISGSINLIFAVFIKDIFYNFISRVSVVR